MIPNFAQFIILLIVSLLCCSIGFKQFVWFMSIGYGLSAAGIGAALLAMALVCKDATILYLIQAVLFIIYGFRLGGFLLIRNLKNEKYKSRSKELGLEAKVPIFVSAFMWIYCGLIYICQSSGPVYRLGNGKQSEVSAFLIVGIIISAIGITLEAIADKQKSAAKAKNPNMPAMDGLFKYSRCPNYFGEMLFWTGAFVSGLDIYTGAQWIVAILGYAEISFVMISGAKRLETRHIKNYGSLQEYNDYADKTPLLIPFVPLYHMTSPEKIAQEEAAKAAKAEARKNKKK